MLSEYYGGIQLLSLHLGAGGFHQNTNVKIGGGRGCHINGNICNHITSQFGLTQIINEPTYILDSSSSCIDLIFTSQPNLIIESVVHL